MCESRAPENGADSADIFDEVATFLVASSFLEALTCGACSLPATDGEYCAGHARLMEYRVTDENHWAANE